MSPARDECRPERATTSVPAEGFGDLVIWRDEIGRVKIQQADPRVRLSAHMVRGFRVVQPPWARCTEDGVLTLTDDHGQRFIYRINFHDHDGATDTYSAEWPD